MAALDRDDVVAEARRIATEVAAPHASEVDRGGRYPREAMQAIAEAGLLSAWIPTEVGGAGADVVQIGLACEELAKGCASTAMIYAMHQCQVACLVHHGRTAYFQDLMRRIAQEQLLVGSATTEMGIGGDVRRSLCHVDRSEDGTFELVKKAPVISYGNEADLIFVTARRRDDAPESDQVLVVCERSDLSLEPLGEWDTMGFRGTCSPGFVLTARSHGDHIFPDDYAELSARTMLPVAHSLWSSCWLGLAEGATAVARGVVRQAARRSGALQPVTGLRMAELEVVLETFRARVHAATRSYLEVDPTSQEATLLGRAIAFNTLKVYAAETVVDVVAKALLVVGIAGYRRSGALSLERQLRDAYGAQLMVNNDRILGNTAQLELIYKG
ncbi:acyl-CoA dehydrogenase family protein [Arsenicicoccus dermatophilus]|uniref:acyl-CoA dehydrogenase family protein n=1 Tax=Arsenicicoccus dermatophilus TaxID=1076331 RepID=UPI001F4CA369|nr:acyl-CoA dehydrogenase family protein [Arsenicicoccus dermatophilus]MCH8612125.1 acyl-CoA/acyl-ACP dehydrogenase [Arsenicicoccus dermatophilus]